MTRFASAWALIGTLAFAASAELNTRPTSRVHVRYVDGIPMRFTSKLSRVVELNFPLNFNHAEGKAAIDAVLDRIAFDYPLGATTAFTVKKFAGPGNGVIPGLPSTMFTLDDLQAADVLVANDVSNLNDLPSKSKAMASAFESAIKTGKSVLGFHGSGDGGDGWSFYNADLQPFRTSAGGIDLVVPVYKDDQESAHVALQDVMVTGTSTEVRAVPMGVDSDGRKILKQNVPTRDMPVWLYQYGTNPLSDPNYRSLSTALLRYDPSSYPFAGSIFRKFPGGYPYSFILKVGQGKAAFLIPGHNPTELAGVNGLDGGTGDFERYIAQMLFPGRIQILILRRSDRLLGFAHCRLPGSADGETFSAAMMVFGPPNASSRTPADKIYSARLTDLRGRVVAAWEGVDEARQPFEPAGLAAGLCILRAGSNRECSHTGSAVSDSTNGHKGKAEDR